MISAIQIISIGLAGAFTLGLLKKSAKDVSAIIMLVAIAAMTYISADWLIALLSGAETAQIFTAGFKPPYSINLQMGLNEAVLSTMINVVGFLGGIYLYKDLKNSGSHAITVFLVFIMGLNVIIMTRDAFNLFVFIEVITSSMDDAITINHV